MIAETKWFYKDFTFLPCIFVCYIVIINLIIRYSKCEQNIKQKFCDHFEKIGP